MAFFNHCSRFYSHPGRNMAENLIMPGSVLVIMSRNVYTNRVRERAKCSESKCMTDRKYFLYPFGKDKFRARQLCVQLASLKFELSNQDSEGGKKSTVLLSMHGFRVSRVSGGFDCRSYCGRGQLMQGSG